MGRLYIFGAIASLLVTMVSISWAATNLNSSKSNVYRLVYPGDLVTQEQASAILAELDKIGLVDEAKLRQLLQQQILPKNGVQTARIKKITIQAERQIICEECVENCTGTCVKSPRGDCFCYERLPTDPARLKKLDKASPVLILLLTNPADETKALESVMNAIQNMK